MRSESDKIAKSPVLVTLGEVEYTIKPLNINKAREWRTHYNEVMGLIVRPMDGSEISASLTAALVAFPEKVADLVFAYAAELPKEKIMEEATEEQITVAFGKIMHIAYPFLASFQTAIQVIKSR